jgi:hypothetical protein
MKQIARTINIGAFVVCLIFSLANCRPQDNTRNAGTEVRDNSASHTRPSPDAGLGSLNSNSQIEGNDQSMNNVSEQGTETQDFEGTARIVERRKENISPVILREVRAARHEKFDRIVFEFEGDMLPGYHIEYVDRPIQQCGSGETVKVAGVAWLEVRFHPSQAHNEAGIPTVKERARRINLSVLKEYQAICDFEADVEWVLGVASRNRYRVLELPGPTRLVIDIKQ